MKKILKKRYLLAFLFFFFIRPLPLFATLKTPNEFYESAVAYYQQGDYSNAIIQLQNVLNLEPSNLSGRILLGKARLKVGNPRAAEKELLIAEEMGSDDTLTAVALADAYLAQGKTEILLTHFDPIQFTKKNGAQMYSRFGDAYLQQKKLSEALKYYQKSLAINPQYPNAIAGKTMVLIEMNQLSKAQQFLTESDTIDTPEIWLVKGIIATRQGRLKEAKAAYLKVLEKEPKHLKARSLLNMVRLDLKEYDIVISDLEKLSLQNYWDPRIFYMLGIAKYESGDEIGAREAMQKTAEVLDVASASEKLQNNGEIRMLTAVVSSINGQHKRAIKAFKKYFLSHKGNISTLKLYASSLLKTGQAEKAIPILKKAQLRDQNDLNILYLLGEAYQKTGNRQQASKIYQAILARYPTHPTISLRYAGIKMAEGQSKQAIAQLSKAQKASPHDGALNRALALAYMETGDLPKGLKIIENLLKENPHNLDLANIQATGFLRMGQYEKAKKAFHQILKKDPSFIQAYLNLAKAEEASGNLTEAIHIYSDILIKQPHHSRVMYELALLEIKRKQFLTAENLLKKALKEDPHLILVAAKLVDIYLVQNKKEAALDLALKMKIMFKKNVLALISLTKAFIATGDNKGALETLRKAYRLAKNEDNYLIQIAKLFLKLKQTETAYSVLERAYKIAPHNREGLYLITLLDLKNNQAKRAKQRILTHLKTAKHNQVYPLLGDIEMALKSYDKAVDAYLKATPSEKNISKLYRAYKYAKQDDKAFNTLEFFVKTHAKASIAAHLYAEELIVQDKITEAMIQYQLLLAHFPNDIAALNNLAGLQIQQRDPEALQTAKLAYQLAPKNASILDTYGWAYHIAGQNEKALKYLREALARNANMSSTQYHIAVVLTQLKKPIQAVHYLKQALKSKQSFPEKIKATQLLQELTP